MTELLSVDLSHTPQKNSKLKYNPSRNQRIGVGISELNSITKHKTSTESDSPPEHYLNAKITGTGSANTTRPEAQQHNTTRGLDVGLLCLLGNHF